jgi:hypothetical protein
MRTAHRPRAANQNDLRSTIRRVIRRARAAAYTANTNISNLADTFVITSDSTLLVTCITPEALVPRLHLNNQSSAVVIPIPPIRSSSSSFFKETLQPQPPIRIDELPATPSYLRATPPRAISSQTKLVKNSPQPKIVKSPSHSKLKRNRSHTEIGKRTRSAELKRASSTTIVYQPQTSGGKSQVHFDLGNEEDEWVDASGSNSPYLSRKGSLNSSNHSVHPDDRSRPVTPNDAAAYKQAEREQEEPEQQNSTSPERETAHRKEYLTSRILKRTPSHGAPPQMSADLAQISPRHFAPASAETPGSGTLAGSNTDELTSRFVEAVGSGLTSDGSFYRPRRGDFPRYDETPHKARSVTSLKGDREERREPPTSTPKEEIDVSALAPKAARRTAPPTAQTSRTQQKLNLQRASSVIEPGQAGSGVGGVVGHTPLIGVGGPGYDGGNSRDPRVGKLLERTGMEYLVVRRYQNPVSRSLERLNHLPGMEKSLRIPRPYSASTNGKRSGDLMMRQHTRNVSMPDARRPVTPKRAASVRTNGAGSSYDGNDDDGRLTDRLSGSSLVGGEEEDGTTALLRNLWEKSAELSASTD